MIKTLIYKSVIPILAIVFCNLVVAQDLSLSITGVEIKSETKNLEQKQYELYELDIKKYLFKPKSAKAKSYKGIDFNLRLGKRSYKMRLFEDDLINPILHDQLSKRGIVPPLTYEGYTSDGNSVRLTVNDGFIYGYIRDGGETYYLEPAEYLSKSAADNQYVLYKEETALANSITNEDVTTCGSHLLKEQRNISESIISSNKDLTKMACRGIRLAIASDYSMVQRYSNNQGVTNHNVGVMNNVQGDYDGIGDDPFEIEFSIEGVYIASSTANNPYASTTSQDIGVLLPEFRTWVMANGFGVGVTPNIGSNSSNTLAQLWSANSLNYQGQGNVIGLAYTPGNFCVLEDYQGNQATGSAWQLRVLTSHEMGHNLSAGHDASGGCVSDGDCIMWPSVSGNTTKWSTASQASIQSNLNNRILGGCAGSCSNGVQDLGEAGIDCGGACDPCPCTAADTYVSPFSITITFDQYAAETSWDIKNANDVVLHNGAYAASNSGTTITEDNIVLPDDLGYAFSFYDAFGDGICCSFGNGSFTITDAEGTVILTGSNFGSAAVKTFCVESDIKDKGCGNGDYTTSASFTSSGEEVYGFNINSANAINTNANVTFTAENSINLNNGFEVGLNAVFEAKIEPCVK